MPYIDIGTSDRAGHNTTHASCNLNSEWCQDELELFESLSYQYNLTRLEPGGEPHYFQRNPDIYIAYEEKDFFGIYWWTLKHGAGIPGSWSPEGDYTPPGTTYEEKAENVAVIREELKKLGIPEPDYLAGVAYDLVQWKNESEAKLDEIKEISEGLADYVENSFYGGLTDISSEIESQNNFLENALDEATSSLSSSIDSGLSDIEAGLSDIKDYVSGGVGDLGDELEEELNSISNYLEGSVSDIGADIEESLEGLPDNIVPEIEDAISDSYSEISKGLSDLSSELEETVPNLIETVEGELTEIGDTIEEQLPAISDLLVSAMLKMPTELIEQLKEAIYFDEDEYLDIMTKVRNAQLKMLEGEK